MNRYRLILLMWHLARSGHCKWSLFMTNNRGQFPSRTIFARCMLGIKSLQFSFHQGREVKLQHFFSLVLYSARCMLGVKSIQFSLHQGRKVKLQHFFSFLLYSARCMLGVESVQFSLHQGNKVKLEHFLFLTVFGTLYIRVRERTVLFTG